MNAREQARVRRLELENQQLREENDRHIRVYREQCIELIELRAKLELVREVLEVSNG